MANKKMAIIAIKGTLDMAYPPFIEYGGAATFLNFAGGTDICLFV